MFGDVPDHIRKRHARAGEASSTLQDVPSIGSLDSLVLPSAPAKYVEIIAPVEARAAVLDSSAKLDELTDKALRFYDDLLSEPLSLDDAKLLSAQTDAARTILTTQLRVDDSRLKKRTSDTLAELLKRMEQEDIRLMKVVS